MGKSKVSSKDLRKTSKGMKEVYYPIEQTDEGKDKHKVPKWMLQMKNKFRP